jgi:hypothetical protein
MRLQHKAALAVRWAARLLGTPLALLIFLDFLADAPPHHRLDPMNIFRLSWTEQVLLDIVLVASLGLLIAWKHELAGGWLAAGGGLVFLITCLIVPGLRLVWGLGVALALPGLLYLLAAHEDFARKPRQLGTL